MFEFRCILWDGSLLHMQGREASRNGERERKRKREAWRRWRETANLLFLALKGNDGSIFCFLFIVISFLFILFYSCFDEFDSFLCELGKSIC